MSSIEEIPNGVGRNPSRPDSLPPIGEPSSDTVEPEDIREPGDVATPIEPDPEEGNPSVPDNIEHA